MHIKFHLLLLLSVISNEAYAQDVLDANSLYMTSYISQREHISNTNAASIVKMSKDDEEKLLIGCRAATKLYANKLGGDEAEINAGQCLAIYDFKMYTKVLSEYMRPKDLTDKEMSKAMEYIDHGAVAKEALKRAVNILSTNNNNFKNRVSHDSTPDDARLYRENEILMRRIAKLENTEIELEEKAEVLSTLIKYSETVACVTNFDGQDSLEPFLKDVYTIERDPEFGQATYYVLWHGDIGCFGGSGTHNYIISEIARDTVSRRFLVKNNDAFGKNIYEQINTRFIESIRQENPNHFIIVSSKLAKDDPVNFPSLKYQYILQRQDGSWKITSRKPLAQ